MFDMTQMEEKIQQDYAKLMEYIAADSRAEQLKAMYSVLQDEMMVAPASGKTHFHNAWPGGYLDHVLRVTEAALKIAGLYKQMNGNITFTKQELIFAAVHHDLGKVGDPDEGPFYIEQDSEWHRKRGELYRHNEHIQYMKPPERGLYLLQKHGIAITQNEWLGIKLSDGMYDDGAKGYFTNYMPYAMKTNLPYIIHWADHIACRVENDKTLFKM